MRSRRRARDLLPARPASRLPGALLRLRGGVAETVEQVHLLLAVAAGGMILRQLLDELPNARANLIGKVRRRRADELVDLLDHRVAHGRSVDDRYPTRSQPIDARMPAPGSRCRRTSARSNLVRSVRSALSFAIPTYGRAWAPIRLASEGAP